MTQPHAIDCKNNLEIYIVTVSGELCPNKAIHLMSHGRNVKTGQKRSQ